MTEALMTRLPRRPILLSETRARLIVIALSALVILCGIFYSFQLGEKLRYADEREYYGLANNLLTKHIYTSDGLNPTAFRPPGYPFLLWLAILLGAKIPHLRILNFIALGLTIYVIYLLTRELSSRFAGLIAAVLVLCYPVLFYMAGTLYPQTIGALLFLVGILIICKANYSSIAPFVVTGSVFGYLILMIPTFLVLFGVITIWTLVCIHRRNFKSCLIMVLSAFLILGFWSARNYSVFKTFVLISYNDGLTLLHGNSENTTANIGPHVDVSKYQAESAEMPGIEKAAYYHSKVIEFVLANKLRAIQLYLYKLLNHFNYHNNFSSASEVPVGRTKDIIMLLTYGPLLLLTGIRLSFFRKIPLHKYEILFLLLYFIHALVSAVFITRIRYRLPFDFLLMIIVAIFIDTLIHGRGSQALAKS